MTVGKGGMSTTDDPDLVNCATRFWDHGRTTGSNHADFGHNFRMTSHCAAIGYVQFDRFSAFTIAQRGNAASPTDHLQGAGVETPNAPCRAPSDYHQNTFQTKDRAPLCVHFTKNTVETVVDYPTPIHEHPAYDHVNVSLPIAERATDRVRSLPIHPGLSVDALSTIAQTVVQSPQTRTVAESADASRLDT